MIKDSKICFIASHLPQGGAEKQMLELIKGLLLKDYDITVFCYQSDICFFDELKTLNIRYHANTRVRSRIALIRWLQNVKYLRSFLAKEEFNILHTFLFHNGIIVRLFSPSKYRNKVVYSVRNSYKSAPKIIRHFDKLLKDRSYNIYNSRKSLEEIFPNADKKSKFNHQVIYNGYNHEKYFFSEAAVTGAITIGMIGRVTKQKNHLQLIRVLNNLDFNDELSIKLYIIGDHELAESEKIKKYIAENNISYQLILLEAVSDVQEYYSRFNLFVLPSLYEGCPNVLFEAMLSKCLCLISEGANSDNFILDGVNGLVYDGTDLMLERKLMEALDSIKVGADKRMLNLGYNYAYSNFSMNKMVESYHKVYSFLKS